MNELILVDFIATYPDDSAILFDKIYKMGKNVVVISENDEFEEDEDFDRKEWIRITVNINSTYASFIKLSDKFLADRMHVYYIPSAMKDKYRK